MSSSVSPSRRPLWTIFSVMLLSGIIGCSGSTGNKISHETMVKIYADVLIISSEYEEGKEPDRYFEQLDSVLTMYGTNRETFESTLRYYQDDPFRWKELIDLVIRDLEDRRDQTTDSSDKRSSS